MRIILFPRGFRAPGDLLYSRGAGIAARVALAVLPWISACSAPPEPTLPPSVRDVYLETDDGYRLTATYYAGQLAGGAAGPGVVLVHGVGGTRQSWDRFARKAQGAGYSVIAFDLRGHGQSAPTKGDAVSYRSFSADQWLGALHDIDAAVSHLVNEGVDPLNTVVAGADIGANLALHYAVKQTALPAVVMVSPGLDYKGVGARDEIAALGQRPVLLMTSTGDSYSASSCATLKPLAQGHCELREYAGTAHGTDLFDTSQAALEQVLLWLKPIIGP